WPEGGGELPREEELRRLLPPARASADRSRIPQEPSQEISRLRRRRGDQDGHRARREAVRIAREPVAGTDHVRLRRTRRGGPGAAPAIDLGDARRAPPEPSRGSGRR